MRLPFLVVSFLGIIHTLDAFIWPIDNEYGPPQFKFTFSELYLYANSDAPLGMQGQAEIVVDLEMDVATVSPSQENMTVMVAVFHVPHEVVSDPVNTDQLNELLRGIASETELCADRMPDPASHVRLHSFPTHSVPIDMVAFDTQGLYDAIGPVREQRHVHVETKYIVKQSGLHSVIVEVCSPSEQWGIVDASTRVKGSMTFRNPYGYLSAIYYGYLPFEGCRATVFALFTFLYLVLLVANWERLMPVHWCILVVVSVAFCEALAWFLAYWDMNNTGQPYCCPFPTAVAVAMVLEALRRTLSRALLLLLCLGFGVARCSLHRHELVGCGLLSAAYLAASLAVAAHDLVEVNDLHRSEATAVHSLWWDFPVLLFDLSFLVWIYTALLQTMADLRDNGQTIKLELYNQLAKVMAVFVAFVTGVTLVVVAARSGFFQWPWQLFWVQTVLWEVLNLAVMVAVTVIWQPSERARLLAMSSQLNTDDWGGDDDGVWNDTDDVELKEATATASAAAAHPSPPSLSQGRGAERLPGRGRQGGGAGAQELEEEDDGEDTTSDSFSIDACVMAESSRDEETLEGRGMHGEEGESYSNLPHVAEI